MHASSTRHAFLRLRTQGLSLASIGRRLHVSKPTIIKWNRELQSQLSNAINDQQCAIISSVAATSETESDALQRRIAALKQELFSRSIQELPTPVLETLLGTFQEKLRSMPTAQGESLAIHNPPSTIHSVRTESNRIEP